LFGENDPLKDHTATLFRYFVIRHSLSFILGIFGVLEKAAIHYSSSVTQSSTPLFLLAFDVTIPVIFPVDRNSIPNWIFVVIKKEYPPATVLHGGQVQS